MEGYMAKQIALFNHKGGVSKTTTTFNLGWMLAKKGKRVIIVDCDPQCNLTGMVLGFKKCLEINKNHPQSWGNLGICLAMLGKKEESLKAFNMALAIDPSYSPAKTNRILVESLKEGEELKEEKFVSINFNKEKFLHQKSFVNKN